MGSCYMREKINEYLDWKGTYTIKAASDYRLTLGRMSEYFKNDFQEITNNDITQFIQHLKNRYSAGSVRYSIVILKNFFWYYNGQTKVDYFKIRIPKQNSTPHYALTEEELIRMDSVFKAGEMWETEKRVIHRLLWKTGMRVSELCDLNIADVSNEEMGALIRTKKNNKMRWIFWDRETHELLLKYLGVRLCLNQQTALFIAKANNRRERITIRTVQRWVKEIARMAGINKKVSPHSYRHGKAHIILDKGGNIKHIAQILGHSETNPMAAFHYIRLNANENKKIALKFL